MSYIHGLLDSIVLEWSYIISDPNEFDIIYDGHFEIRYLLVVSKCQCCFYMNNFIVDANHKIVKIKHECFNYEQNLNVLRDILVKEYKYINHYYEKLVDIIISTINKKIQNKWEYTKLYLLAKKENPHIGLGSLPNDIWKYIILPIIMNYNKNIKLYDFVKPYLVYTY